VGAKRGKKRVNSVKNQKKSSVLSSVRAKLALLSDDSQAGKWKRKKKSVRKVSGNSRVTISASRKTPTTHSATTKSGSTFLILKFLRLSSSSSFPSTHPVFFLIRKIRKIREEVCRKGKQRPPIDCFFMHCDPKLFLTRRLERTGRMRMANK
jgi:hypothetical protein